MNQFVVKILLLIALVVSSTFAQCGPPQCYNGCADARPIVDFVFLIDLSGSMSDNIQAVTGGKFFLECCKKKIFFDLKIYIYMIYSSLNIFCPKPSNCFHQPFL